MSAIILSVNRQSAILVNVVAANETHVVNIEKTRKKEHFDTILFVEMDGATTYSKMTFSTTTLSILDIITTLGKYDVHQNDKHWGKNLFVIQNGKRSK